MTSVLDEIRRIQSAKTDIEEAIEYCGVDIPDTALIDTYAPYIKSIPDTLFTTLNYNLIGGDDFYIKTIKQSNGLINATTGGLVSSTSSGLSPKIGTSASSTISALANEWVLTSTNGGSPSWRKLPSNAFKNDNTNTTYSLSGALSANTYITTLTDSASGKTTATIPAMSGASSTAAGTAGLVPAPEANKHTAFLRGDGTWAVPTNYYRPISVNGTSILENNNTTLNLVAGASISITAENSSGYTGKVTITNTGVRSTTINGNYLRVNTNGTNADLTIPYATSAGSIAWTNVSGKPSFATVATSGSYNDLSNKPSIPTVTDYYWADIKVSASSSTNTTPTFTKWTTSDLNLVSYTTGGKDLGMKITGKSNSIGFIIGSGNINRGIYDYTNSTWILHKNLNNHIILTADRVGIGSDPTHTLDVIGSVGFGNNSGCDVFLRRSGGYSYINATSSLALTVNNSSSNIAVGIATDKHATFYGSQTLHGLTSTCNKSSDSNYMNSALQIREYNFGGALTDSWGVAPRLSWHWSGRVQTQIGLNSLGDLKLSKDNFTTSYLLLHAGNSSVSGGGSSGGSSITVNIGGASKTLTIPTSLPANGGNADKLDNLHSYAFKKTWEAHAGKTYVGWVTIAKWTVSSAGYFSPRPFMLSIYRGYNSPASESYTFSITCGWDTATITQVSGNAKDRIIEKLRIGTDSNKLTYKLEMYVNTAYTTYDNTCYCVAYGYYDNDFSADTTCELTSKVSLTLAEISTSSGNIVGNLSGTAISAYYVFDYNAISTPIYIGFASTGLTSTTASYLAAYGTTSSGARCIKNISAAEAKKFIGLGNVQNTAFYQRDVTVNGATWNMAGPWNSAAFTIYAPTTAGTAGQVLTSTAGTPGWTNQSSLSAGCLNIHDIRNNNYTPNSTSWPLYNIKAWFNNSGTPNGDWWSGITVKGWTNDYNVWLLASTSTNHSYANFGLFFRTGNGSSWTNWKNVVTSESVNNIVVTSSLPATKVNNTIYILI